jgi:hypothetical protein
LDVLVVNDAGHVQQTRLCDLYGLRDHFQSLLDYFQDNIAVLEDVLGQVKVAYFLGDLITAELLLEEVHCFADCFTEAFMNFEQLCSF